METCKRDCGKTSGYLFFQIDIIDDDAKASDSESSDSPSRHRRFFILQFLMRLGENRLWIVEGVSERVMGMEAISRG